MLDDKTLTQWEQSAQVLGITDGQEIIRNARRYLALRKNCGVFMLSDGIAVLFPDDYDPTPADPALLETLLSWEAPE